MPVIVDEVVISVEVSDGKKDDTVSTSGSEENHTIVSECVERVLDILAQKAER
jgi:hypothetical protein